MPKIQELSPLLADQIAAGEVVERPASVVKELVENAIDAKSTQIDIIIEEAGLKKIQVIDNGEGMVHEDALMAFKRHATSKLYSREDLFRIRTLGFRGEALPSIASVSYITLETGTGVGEGTYVHLKAGDIIEHRLHIARKGTSMTVEQLFFNTPARLKFVSSLQRETANIADLINRLALAHPDISFSLTSDNNRLIKTAGNGNLQQTLAGVYTPAIARSMKAVAHENLDFKVSGFTSLPELTRSNRNYMSIFINGRYIKNYALNNAIVEGYESKLMIGRFPITVLNIEMDYSLVDVNVHPTKQQVRISQEKELGQLIKEAISQVMNTAIRIPSSLPKRFDSKPEQVQLDFSQLMSLEQKAPESVLQEGIPNLENTTIVEAHSSEELSNGYQVREEDAPFITEDKGMPANQTVLPHQRVLANLEAGIQDVPANQTVSPQQGVSVHQNIATDSVKAVTSDGSSNQKQGDSSSKTAEMFPELHYFGQMHGTYLFAENDKGMYIIDQHAAQERIKYEYYRVEIGKVGTEQQGMLVPLVLTYPTNEFLLIQQYKKILEDIHIYLKEFGQNSFLLEEHPIWIKQDIEQTVRDLIAVLLEKGSVSVAKFREDTAIMMSCKKSIKANHYLNDEQARTLLNDLALCQNPYNCPHGRPVLIHLSHTDMEKMFKRIQDR